MDTGKLPHGIAVINGILRHGVGQAEPNLKQVHLCSIFSMTIAATFALGIIRLNDTDPFAPGNDFVHDFQKFFPLGFLLAQAVLNICEGFLFHNQHHRSLDEDILLYWLLVRKG